MSACPSIVNVCGPLPSDSTASWICAIVSANAAATRGSRNAAAIAALDVRILAAVGSLPFELRA